jgi:hypothetical protein
VTLRLVPVALQAHPPLAVIVVAGVNANALAHLAHAQVLQVLAVLAPLAPTVAVLAPLAHVPVLRVLHVAVLAHLAHVPVLQALAVVAVFVAVALAGTGADPVSAVKQITLQSCCNVHP